MFLLRKLSGRSGPGTTHQDDSNISSHDVLKQALDQASEYVSEGDYEEAVWILERLGQLDPAVKGVAELAAVAEVCNAAVLRSCSCLSRENKNPDWYKVLKVDEKSELSAIKKRYRHLALLLHPDKNKHAKAEAAFKLVSEAYACLSDKKKRANFNAKRAFVKCKHCSSGDFAPSGSDRWSGYHVLREKTSLRRPGSSPDLTQTDWILDQERLKIFRARARARVFGNLEKAWKERGFTERTRVVKEDFQKHPKDQVRMDPGQPQCRTRTGESNQVKEENLTDCLTAVEDKGSKAEGNMVDVSQQKELNHQQLFQPCKNLGVLIRDLQAELVSSTEGRGYQNDERDVYKKHTSENATRPDVREAGSHVHGTWDGMSKPHKGDFTQQFPGTSQAVSHNQAVRAGKETICAVGNHSVSLSAQGHECPDGLLGNNLSTLKATADKDFLHKNRREHNSNSAKAEAVTVVDSQTVQESEEKDYTRILNQDGDSSDAVLKKHSLCRQTRKNDSLDLEERILRTQREKSEQLLKTLQRLREETRTVAASLNHLCSGCSS